MKERNEIKSKDKINKTWEINLKSKIEMRLNKKIIY